LAKALKAAHYQYISSYQDTLIFNLQLRSAACNFAGDQDKRVITVALIEPT
jgi:hypothetical protein